MSQEIIQKIKTIKWDKRVTRAGYLQSKQIVSEACMSILKLTNSVSVTYDNFLWVNDLNLYDEEATIQFSKDFNKAFEEDKNWPLKTADFIENYSKVVDDLLFRLGNVSQHDEKEMLFSEYVETLKSVQRYYIIAVPLTNYCEKRINDKRLTDSYARSFIPIELEKMQDSLDKIKSDEDIEKHIKKYEWIKTTYNIAKKYSIDDVKNDLEHTYEKEISKKRKVPINKRHFVEGLQVGIYLRNKMKELSQKLWFYVEGLVNYMANDLNISRDDFFQLRTKEVLESYKNGRCLVSRNDLGKRQIGFITGFLGKNEVLVDGKEALKLLNYYSKNAEGITKVEGRAASKGYVKGKVKIILNLNYIEDFEQGKILVTSMTSPEFKTILNKAAAIVTDEGGLSCHAALFSREMGIPYIGGTEYATKVFKDGDLVEVDANKGIVRKVKEKSL